jgi:Flp pilus assembly protein TadG
MSRSLGVKSPFARFHRSRSGNVLIIAALMSSVLVYAVGVAVDYMDAVDFRTTLQNTVDTAALAGAAAYTSCASTGLGSQANAQTIATNVFNATALSWHNGTVTPTATGSTTGNACPGTPTAYEMTVSASGTVPTTFLAVLTSSMAVSATATAINPVVSATANAGGWSSSAWDANYIYEYPIPSDGSVPTFNTANMFAGSGNLNATVNFTSGNGQFTFLFTNMPDTVAGGAIPSSQNLSIAASQKVGFVLVNQTDGRLCYSTGNTYSPSSCSSANTANNGQYTQGGSPAQTAGAYHEYYSQLTNPNANSYDGNFDISGDSNLLGCSNTGGTSGFSCTTAQNCSLQTVTTFSTGVAVTASSINNNSDTGANVPAQGYCHGTTYQQPFTNESCGQLGNQAVYYEWNDMGGGTDDYDYNDAEFGFYCGTGSGAPQTVHLIS